MARTLIRSRYLATMDGPLIEDGAVLMDGGRILAVDRASNLSGAVTDDLGDCILLPGLVNAHAHLELSDCTPGERPTGGLEQWLTRMLSRTRIDVAELEQKSMLAARQGAEQCGRFGVTTVGDISRQCHVTRPVLRDLPLRVISFGEVMAMAQRRGLLEERITMAADRTHESETLAIGISPHSPYSIEPAGYLRCLETARAADLPIATHLAETPGEWAFLASHSGPLKELWDAWLTWDDEVPRYAGGPIRLAQEIGLLAYGALLAHVNYCSDEELQILRAGRSSVVYCPRTHDFFGHPPHRFREMLQMGINVAIGTDSCASSPNLNLVDDLRLVHERYSGIDAHALWQMATVNGAKALRREATTGTLAPGKYADLVAFPATSDDPLREVLENGSLPAGVWLAGEKIA